MIVYLIVRQHRVYNSLIYSLMAKVVQKYFTSHYAGNVDTFYSYV